MGLLVGDAVKAATAPTLCLRVQDVCISLVYVYRARVCVGLCAGRATPLGAGSWTPAPGSALARRRGADLPQGDDRPPSHRHPGRVGTRSTQLSWEQAHHPPDSPGRDRVCWPAVCLPHRWTGVGFELSRRSQSLPAFAGRSREGGGVCLLSLSPLRSGLLTAAHPPMLQLGELTGSKSP